MNADESRYASTLAQAPSLDPECQPANAVVIPLPLRLGCWVGSPTSSLAIASAAATCPTDALPFTPSPLDEPKEPLEQNRDYFRMARYPPGISQPPRRRGRDRHS